jgi:hypothetical protein
MWAPTPGQRKLRPGLSLLVTERPRILTMALGTHDSRALAIPICDPSRTETRLSTNQTEPWPLVHRYLHVHLLVSQPGRGIALIIRRKPLTKPLSARASTSASAQLHAAVTSPSFRHKHCRAEATVGASHATRPQLLQLHQKAISLLIHRPPLSPSLPTYVACIPLLLPTCCNSFLFHIPQL